MSQTRLVIAAVAVVVLVAIGGVVVYFSQSHGGKNVTFNVAVTGAKSMSPDTLTVNHNDNVTINVTSDTEGEVHLHGYDIHFDTKPGQTVSHTFKADKTGHFDIEWESTSVGLGTLVVNG